jgi:hypothetical protein
VKGSTSSVSSSYLANTKGSENKFSTNLKGLENKAKSSGEESLKVPFSQSKILDFSANSKSLLVLGPRAHNPVTPKD